MGREIIPMQMDARSDLGVARCTDEKDEGMLVIGADLNDVKWINVPTIGRRSVCSVQPHTCPACGGTHDTADCGNHEGKRLLVVRCPVAKQFLVFTKRGDK